MQNNFQIAPSESKELRDVEDCGKRPKREDNFIFNECLWDCKWRDNPLYQDGDSAIIGDGDNKLHIGDYIIQIISTPKVPEDLSCLR